MQINSCNFLYLLPYHLDLFDNALQKQGSMDDLFLIKLAPSTDMKKKPNERIRAPIINNLLNI